jgi:hypothetical protein
MVKMHAAGALPALALAALWRPPPRDWLPRARADARAFVAARRGRLATAAAVWLVIAVAMNLVRAPFGLTGRPLLWGLAVALLGVAGIGLAVLTPRLTGLGLAVAGIQLGLAIPISLDIPDGLRSLVKLRTGLTGGGINESVPRFSMPLHRLVEAPLKQAFAVFLVAGLAAVVGIVRRDPKPAVWFVGSTVLGIMAAARLGAVHYFAPAYVLAILAALWLLRERRALGVLAACVLLWYAAWPTWQHRDGPADDAARFAALVAPGKAWLDTHLRPNEVAMVPSYWPFADSRYLELVELYVTYTPPYPYHELTGTQYGALFAASRNFVQRYYLGPPVEVMHGNTLVTDAGTFVARKVPDVPLVAELLHGPGVDRPWNQPTAHYDPWTGYFKDPQGRYWAWAGQQIAEPPRRRYLAKERLWVDAFGDLWNARGEHLGNRPDLRTAP